MELTTEQIELLTNQFVSKLLEHDVVAQVMLSYHSPEGTKSYYRGEGNWFARQGMAHEFINRDSSETLANYLKTEDE